MQPRISMITLAVADPARAIRFSRHGHGLPRHPVAGDVALFPLAGSWLGLYGRADLAADAGGTLVRPGRDTDWGGYAGYFAGPDGHLWEVAWNPHLRVGPADSEAAA